MVATAPTLTLPRKRGRETADRSDDEAAAHALNPVDHVSKPRASGVLRHVEAGTVISDLERKFIGKGTKVDLDSRCPSMLRHVLQRFKADEVDGGLHVGRVA